MHPDDPFLCLVPCEVARVASALQAHQHNHLETYRHLGFRLSDALVRWFESGVGHRVWSTVRREHPHALDPTLLPRRREKLPKAAGRKRGRSTCPVRPTLTDGGRPGHIKASKSRQRQAAMGKALKDAVWYV